MKEHPLIIPVPLHKRRLRHRKYNQAALIARYLAGKTQCNVMLDGLCRRHFTKPLAQLLVAERKEQLQDSMYVRERHIPLIRGRMIVLVDDIFTTGATVDACCDALYREGAMNVDVVVAARVCIGEGYPSF